MTSKSSNDLAQDWYRFSIMDFNSANTLNQYMHPKPLEIICYHCQQAAEKMLKGFLVANIIEPPKIHDLPLLCDMCIKIDNNFQALYDICEFLTQYGVQPRYPNEIEIFETDVEKALQSVQTMVEFFGNQGIALKFD